VKPPALSLLHFLALTPASAFATLKIGAAALDFTIEAVR
jgi:hypothetical protein